MILLVNIDPDTSLLEQVVHIRVLGRILEMKVYLMKLDAYIGIITKK